MRKENMAVESSVVFACPVSISTYFGRSPSDFDLGNYPSLTGHILSRSAIYGTLTIPYTPVQRMET